MLPWIVLTSAALALNLFGEWRKQRVLIWVGKPLASTGFVLAAATRHAHETGYGTAILIALLLSFAGDILLIPKSQRVFKVGILTFLAGHLAFCVAFIIRGLSLPWALGAGLPLLAAGIPIGRWIVTRAPARLRGAVAVYIGVLSVMVTLAVASHGRHPDLVLPLAAVAFYFSDLSVALNRFVRPALSHRLWGLPLYFGAQLLFAWTVWIH